MAEILLFVLEIQCQSLRVEVLWNDIQVFTELAGTRKTSQLKLNPYVLEGRNHMQVLLGPIWQEGSTPVGANAPHFQLQLVKGEHGREPAEEGKLAVYLWNPMEKPLRPDGMTLVWEQEIEVDSPFGRWAWQNAPAMPISTADRRAILALVSRVHAAFTRRNMATLAQLLALKNEEMSRAVGIPRERTAIGQERFFGSFFDASDWMMEPLNPETLLLTPRAGGRLVQITDSAGNPPLQGTAGNRPFAFELTVSYIDEVWKIVR